MLMSTYETLIVVLSMMEIIVMLLVALINTKK